MKKNYKIKNISGVDINVNYYQCENPKAIFQIIHGMQEHIERYDDFANFLCSNGYNVILNDIFGHGKSTNEEHPLGDLINFKNILNSLDDVYNSTSFNGKRIIMGHSMGSFIARSYTYLNPSDIAIFMGTGDVPDFLAKKLRLILKFKDENSDFSIFHKIINLNFNSKIKNSNDFSWLSVNEENQKNYINDPYCGIEFKKSGFIALLDMIFSMNEKEKYKNKSKRILIISGADDPVGNYSKGVEKIYKKYKKQNENTDLKLFENMRHEILNEKDNKKVYKFILDYIDKYI